MSTRVAYAKFLPAIVAFAGLGLAGCGNGTPGPQGPQGDPGPAGPAGPPGVAVIDIGDSPADALAKLDVRSEITGVTIASPPVVDFTVMTAGGTPVTGIGAYWEDDDRFVRFTLTKLVAGENGDPSSWVAYTRDTTNDGSTPPDYDTGSSLVDHGDGTYTFTFNTDVNMVSGVDYEPTLTHRVAGQIGSGDVALPAQNLVMDFVPGGGTVTETRNIATISSCNECHEELNFHGRRFKVEYCVNCHNADLAEGEGDMAYMTHKIHAGHKFNVLDDGIDYSEVTYPQDLANCRKCHSSEDEATPDGDNWRTVPSISACGSCHLVSFVNPPPAGLTLHSGGTQENNFGCATCHPASGGIAGIEDSHTTANPTPNNPNLPASVPAMAFDITSVTVNGAGNPTVTFTVTADGDVLDVNNLPDGFVDGNGDAFRWPAFLMAWAESQDGITNPADYTNTGQNGAQPMSVDLGDLVAAGGVDCSSGTDCVADFSTTADAFPAGASLRAIALQGYFQFDSDGDEAQDTSLHTLSAVMAATGDDVRREIVDSNKCGACHEWFEGHGGNRVVGLSSVMPMEPSVCAVCHVPNLSTSGRGIDPARAADRDGDPMTDDPSAATVSLGTSNTAIWPEDTNNFKDMIHGIHASAIRSSDYEFVRGRNDGIYYDWAEVTYPAENGARNCLMCHMEGTYQLPLNENVLGTTVRTTGTNDGFDGGSHTNVGTARDNVPNATDWVNTPTASTCYYCHDSALTVAHMRQNGGIISFADTGADDYTQRQDVATVESCAVCHGAGSISDVSAAHMLVE
ncbi:MAG TPA: OmcA/MtrC family decaheme c-type cytochrome [Phycisphaerae bacterium]|nr:OmcA/MtrC family decaheme c-type cytochrome [Phycisphaerae bacterium]